MQDGVLGKRSCASFRRGGLLNTQNLDLLLLDP
jgi:hypothetical protein